MILTAFVINEIGCELFLNGKDVAKFHMILIYLVSFYTIAKSYQVSFLLHIIDTIQVRTLFEWRLY